MMLQQIREHEGNTSDNTDTLDSHMRVCEQHNEHKLSEISEELRKYWIYVVSSLSYGELIDLANDADPLEIIQSLRVLEEQRQEQYKLDKAEMEKLKEQSNVALSDVVSKLSIQLSDFQQVIIEKNAQILIQLADQSEQTAQISELKNKLSQQEAKFRQQLKILNEQLFQQKVGMLSRQQSMHVHSGRLPNNNRSQYNSPSSFQGTHTTRTKLTNVLGSHDQH